jgi:hypothetical protein
MFQACCRDCERRKLIFDVNALAFGNDRSALVVL